MDGREGRGRVSDGGATMKGRLSLGQLVSGVAGMLVAIWLGDYLFPDAASSMGDGLFAAAKGIVGICLGLIAHEVVRSFRTWLPK